MKSVQIDTKTAALCLGLTAALLTAGCNGKRTYSLGSGGGFGADGATGPAGPKGDTGPAGPAGPQGPAGPAGMAGLDGLNGLPGLAGNGLGQVTIGDRTILGQAGGAPGPLGVSVLSPTVQSGEVATVGVLSGGQVAAVALGQPKTPVDPATGPTTSPLGLTVGGHQLLGSGETNAVGLNVLSPTGASGTAVTGNLLSNGQPVAVGVTQPATGATPGAGGLVGGVTGVVGGVLPGGAPAGGSTGGGLIGGLLGGLKK